MIDRLQSICNLTTWNKFKTQLLLKKNETEILIDMLEFELDSLCGGIIVDYFDEMEDDQFFPLLNSFKEKAIQYCLKKSKRLE